MRDDEQVRGLIEINNLSVGRPCLVAWGPGEKKNDGGILVLPDWFDGTSKRGSPPRPEKKNIDRSIDLYIYIYIYIYRDIYIYNIEIEIYRETYRGID